MLYERDYLLGLTEAEKQEYEEATGRKFGEKRVSGFGRVNNFLAYRCYLFDCMSEWHGFFKKRVRKGMQDQEYKIKYS